MMIKIKTLFFLVGFFLCFPFVYLPVGNGNIRFEDLAILLLLMFTVIHNKKLYSKNILIFSSIFILFIFYGLFLRFFYNFNYDNYPLTRMIGITIYFFVFSFYMNQYELKNLCRGAVVGSILSIFVIFVALLTHLLSIGFTIRNMYVFKESLRGISSFNPNSYGALMVFGSFAAYYLYSITKSNLYKYSSFLFLCIPFILIIRRDIVGIIVGLVAVFFLSRSIKTKIILYPALILICSYLTFVLIGYFKELESYKFMAHRDAQYIAAYNAIQDNKMGYGIGAETFIMKDSINRESVTHNSFLSLSLEIGIFNTLIILFMICFIFFSLKNVWFKFYLIVFFVQSQFGNGFYFYKYHFIFIALLLCIITISWRANKDNEKNPSILAK